MRLGVAVLALVAGFALKLGPVDTQLEGQLFSLVETAVEPTPTGSVPVELLRYVTPYQQDMDVETDVTQHMPLIRGKESLSLYSMIDTWVGGRPSSFIWLNSTANQCMTMANPSDENGNGFDLKATLHFYEAPATDGRATKVVPAVSATPFGNVAPVGELAYSEALLQKGATIHAGDMPQCPGGDCAGPAAVYRCEFPEKGNCIHQLRNSFKEMDMYGGSSFIERESSGRVHRSDLSDTRDVVEELDRKTRRYKVRLEKSDVGKTWNKGDMVFAPKRQPTEDSWLGRDMGDAPLSEAGVVESVDPAGFATVRFNPTECIPSPVSDAIMSRAWKVAVPAAARSTEGTNTAADALKLGTAVHGDAKEIAVDGKVASAADYVVTPKDATSPSLLQTGSNGRESLDALVGSKVVLVQPSGQRLLQTTVDLGEPLKPNERYIAHFVSTGHGWENTNDQCAEFCKMSYRLTMDAAGSREEGYSLLERATEAAQFSLWRDDCGSNPLSDQQGTWTTERNGWCPGAVSNGYFADVTSLVQQGGLHKVGVEATVDEDDAKPFYENWKGFAYKDMAKLEMSLNFFRYTESDHAEHSFAEFSSFIEKERPVSFVEFTRGLKMEPSADETPAASFVETDMVGNMVGKHALKGKQDEHQREKAKKGTQKRYTSSGSGDAVDYAAFLGANAPWFNYDGDLRKPPDVVVPLFGGIIHQSSNRLVMADVPVPKLAELDPKKNYNVGLRLQLRSPPPPLSVDKWDRYATFGLFMQDKSSPNLRIA